MVSTAPTLESNGTAGLQDVGSLSWSEVTEKYNIPTLHRYKVEPEMLEGEIEKPFENQGSKVKGSIVFNRNFVIAKFSALLNDLGMYDASQIEELLGEVAEYRQSEIAEEKDKVAIDALSALARINPKAAEAAKKVLGL